MIKTTLDFVKKFSIPDIPALEVIKNTKSNAHLVQQDEWSLPVPRQKQGKTMIQTHHLAVLSVLHFLEGKLQKIVSFAIPHVICWYHSSWWVAYNFQDSTGWSLGTTHFLGMIDFPYMFFSMKTMFPGWFSMWAQGNSNTFVSSPCRNPYDFPYMIYELYCASQPMRKPRKNASCWWDPKSSIHQRKRTCPLKRGSFRKQSSLPTTIFSRTCMFSGK